MFEQFSKPMIFAHRGACALAPENTLCSFELAITLQADAIELDAKLSKDGVVMVIHDQTVDRTTDGTGKVMDLTLADLKSLDAGSFLGNQFSGERIPTLDEVFEIVGKKLIVNVELTNYKSKKDALVENVVEIVKRHNYQDNVLFSSFFPENLIKCQKLVPNIPTALLCLPGILGWFSRSSLSKHFSPQIIHPYIKDVNQKYIKKEHQGGRRVHVWTVNDEKDILFLRNSGADGIFTDNPLNTRKILEKK